MDSGDREEILDTVEDLMTIIAAIIAIEKMVIRIEITITEKIGTTETVERTKALKVMNQDRKIMWN